MFAQEFMRHALLAGLMIGTAAGLTGYLIVLRAQVFAGDALSHVAFTGALAAAAFGVDARIGLVLSTVTVALLLGVLRGEASDDIAIGSTFAWILGVGVLFLSLYTTRHSDGNATAKVRVLFGSIFGLSTSDTIAAVVVCGVIIVGCLALLRPLLFVSLDPRVAAARGVPERFVTLAFMALFGLEAAEATQAVGALLLLALIAAPGGAARLLTTNPYRGALLGALLGAGSVAGGLAMSYEWTSLPPSFSITTLAAGTFVAAMVRSALTTEDRMVEPAVPA